jgi:hypothetical protein
LLVALSPGGPPGERGRIEATVANSEWTPPGEVSLDLRTGRYRLRHAPARNAPSAPVHTTRGRLAAAELQPLRAAYAEARAEGLIEPICRNGGRPAEIVVSNGGLDYLVLTGGGRQLEAPRELGCWTQAARNLDALLEATFGWRARPQRR